MYTCKQFHRMRKSRDEWKIRALAATRKARQVAQRERYCRHKVMRLREENAALRQENLARPADAARGTASELRVLPQATVVSLAVHLVAVAHVSFRAVPRILLLLGRELRFLLAVPHYTSVIEWVLRVGLASLRTAVRTQEPWIALLDFSIQCGQEKVLVVLRLPLHFLRDHGRAPCLADCDPLVATVRAGWSAASLCEELSQVTKRFGQPVYWLSDEGTDLKAALQKLPRSPGARAKAYHLHDVGHVLANALKHIFAGNSRFESFVAALGRCGPRIRQTEFAHLAPPRLRRKRRFQSLERVSAWFESLRECRARQKRAGARTCFQVRLQEFFAWTEDYVELMRDLGTLLGISNRIQGIVKTRGMAQATWNEVKAILDELPYGHPFVQPGAIRDARLSNSRRGFAIKVRHG